MERITDSPDAWPTAINADFFRVRSAGEFHGRFAELLSISDN